MHRPGYAALTAVALFSLTLVSTVSPQPALAALDADAARCMASKLKTTGKLMQKQLGCYAKAIKKGVAVDTDCLAKPASKLVGAFTKAEALGGCLDDGDAAYIIGRSLGSARIIADGLTTDPLTRSACTGSKIKASSKRTSKTMKAYSVAVAKADTGKLIASLTKITEKFDSDFAKAELKSGCQTTGDASDAAARADSGLDPLYGDLGVVAFETVSVPSAAAPAETPGSGATDASGYPKLVTQYGTADVDLNNGIYTRFYYQPDDTPVDAVLVLVPGFEGGGNSFLPLAQNLVSRAVENGRRVELWALDRRGHQLEDLEGKAIAAQQADPQIALDWFFGGELGLTLSPQLTRRAQFHNTQEDTAFMANWTTNVVSKDIDAVIDAALAAVGNGNVFLGGHSAGTGHTARYAATDFDISSPGVLAGYTKLRGLVLLEGGGGSSSGTAPTEDELDLIEDRADGGLFYAVRDNAPRCADGTVCTVATEATDCLGIGNGKCVEPVAAYSVVPGLLNPQVLVSGEITSIQAINDPNTGESILTVDQGGVDNNAVAVVPELNVLNILGTTTALGGLGRFVDDDLPIAQAATFVASSAGAQGPTVGGLITWQPTTEPPLPLSVLVDNGPAPTALPGARWGVEVEVVRMDRLTETFYRGESNFTDWYYPGGGYSTTAELPELDTSALSIGRNRPDIENITQAANIDIPVICFGGSNGLTPIGQSFLAFAQSIGACAAPSCDGTPRVVDTLLPSEAFPTYGDENGGFSVFIDEGIAHVDVAVADDTNDMPIVERVLEFIERNSQ